MIDSADVELLLNGGYSPLKGFMGKADYDSVRDNMRLTDNTLWVAENRRNPKRATAWDLPTGQVRFAKYGR